VDECAGPDGKLLGDAGVAKIMRNLRQTQGMAFLESVGWKLAQFSGRDDFDDDVAGGLLGFKPVGTAT